MKTSESILTPNRLLSDWMQLPAGFDPPKAAAGPARLRQLTGFKRWFYLLLSSERHQIGVAWVDLGYISKVFAHFSPHDGSESISVEALCLGQRHPWRQTPGGWVLRAGSPGLRLEIRSEQGLGLLNLSSKSLSLAARWQADGGPLLQAQAPLPHYTHKAMGLPCRWSVTARGRSQSVTGQLGADVSFGWPPRHTRWYWAFAQSPDLGFNLVEGFVGAAECALWHQGELLPLAEGRFAIQDRQWRIGSADGALNLSFVPASSYLDHTQLGVVSSKFIQTYGRFTGKIALPDRSLELDLPGVAEFQDTRW